MPKVTGIIRRERDAHRLSVFVDGKFSFGCTAEKIASLEIHEGDEVTKERLDAIKQSLQDDIVRQKCLWYIGRRARSRIELKRYLTHKGFEAAQVEDVLSWLTERGYLNDEKFADDWVRSSLQTSARGRQKLFKELFQKGIDRDAAQKVVDQYLPEQDESEVAYQLLLQRRKRFHGLEERLVKGKIYNFLTFRGFSNEAALVAYKRFVKELYSERDR